MILYDDCHIYVNIWQFVKLLHDYKSETIFNPYKCKWTTLDEKKFPHCKDKGQIMLSNNRVNEWNSKPFNKVTTPNFNCVLKSTNLGSCLKCTPTIDESLWSILETLIFSLFIHWLPTRHPQKFFNIIMRSNVRVG